MRSEKFDADDDDDDNNNKNNHKNINTILMSKTHIVHCLNKAYILFKSKLTSDS